LLAAFSLLLTPAAPVSATAVSDFLDTLSPEQAEQFKAYRYAHNIYNRKLDAYWQAVEEKRARRRKKRAARLAFTRDDYVSTFPPEYRGPQLDKQIARLWAKFLADRGGGTPSKPREELPGVSDFLHHSRAIYGFVPERISEHEFKVRYAREALRLGLTKEQVVRVYALETGGHGTADMQSGINPITRKGRPISSALGYAQLLHANSVSELAKHGNSFVERLQRMARQPGTSPQRAAQLAVKIKALRKMIANARKLPEIWSRHVAYANTPGGLGIHAINMDGDIGPWLQVIKLRGIKDIADKAGRNRLAPAEMELMNLAGPGTGLEMMQPVGRAMPTTNFFARAAYGRNTIVRGKTAAELLAALDSRMDANMKKPGSVEFAAVFDELGSTEAERLPWR
jgi:hypothetical protein